MLTGGVMISRIPTCIIIYLPPLKKLFQENYPQKIFHNLVDTLEYFLRDGSYSNIHFLAKPSRPFAKTLLYCNRLSRCMQAPLRDRTKSTLPAVGHRMPTSTNFMLPEYPEMKPLAIRMAFDIF
jgi:hypothetical protein